MDIAVDREGCSLRVVQDRFEASSEKVPVALMEAVVPGAIRNVEPLHGLAQVRVLRFDLQMIVGAHQRVGMDLQGEALGELAEKFQKIEVPVVVEENRSLFHAPVDHMIPPSWDIESQRPGHPGIQADLAIQGQMEC